MSEKWIIGEPGGPAGPFYSVVTQQGRIIAMQIPDRKAAEQIAAIPDLLSACEELVREADNGSWHLSEDCRVEQRHDCELCAAIEQARVVLAKARGEVT